MELTKYQRVIEMVFSDHAAANADPLDFFNDLVKSIKIAQALRGEIPEVAPASGVEVLSKRTQKVSIETMPSNQEVVERFDAKIKSRINGPVIISAAPPVAGADESDGTPEEDIDYWESKPGKGDGCGRLEAALKKMMPKSITVKIPNMDKPLELVCGIGSPGARFVHVNYSVPGGELGPRFTLMTSQKEIDKDAILKDIVDQAAAFYSAEKRVIAPTPGPPIQPPSGREMQEALERDMRSRDPRDRNDGLSGDEARLASEDAKIWANNRGPQWR